MKINLSTRLPIISIFPGPPARPAQQNQGAGSEEPHKDDDQKEAERVLAQECAKEQEECQQEIDKAE
eukprot:11544091-Heterocapsa_arctica.AAC.1